jgi:hypothetical protein
VWSTDWFDNPDLQTDRLVKQIEELLARPVAPYEDYIIAPVNASGAAEPMRPDQTIFREPPPCSAENDDGNGAVNNSPRVRRNGTSGDPAFAKSEPLSEHEVCRKLREFRDTVIAVQTENWDPHRSILRESMIETLVAQRVRDPNDWFPKVPQFQRAGTNPLEKQRYFDQVCEIVDRIDDARGFKLDGSGIVHASADHSPIVT